MSLTLDPALLEAAAKIGWAPRDTGRQGETCLGDYTRGYLMLDRGEYIQLARRSERGAPSLRLWSPNPEFLQKYIAFQVGQLIRYDQDQQPIALPTAETAVRAPFRLSKGDVGGVFLHWSDSEWAGFGLGNEFVAAQVSQYAQHSISDIIRLTLSGQEF